MAEVRLMRARSAVAGVLAALTIAPAAAADELSVQAALHDEAHARYEERYLDVRTKFIREFGKEQAGRNLVWFGASENRHASRGRVKDSTGYMWAALNPPEVLYASGSAGSMQSGLCDASCVECESGGDPSAQNPAGYWGLYQYDQQSWEADGGDPASYGSASAAEQSAVAANASFDRWPNC